MKADAILLNAKDNVVTVVNGADEGQEIFYFKGSSLCSIKTVEKIPPCHKIAIVPIAKGDYIIKYGEIIGGAQQDIGAGCWVSHLNIESLPRNYDSELN